MKNIKPIILDTTYILPLFGIEIIDLDDFKNISNKIWSKGIDGYNIFLPSTCLMEALYKLTSEYRKSKDIAILNRFPTTIPSIESSKMVQLYNPLLYFDASKIAIKIRHAGHTDLMDCLIAGSAAVLKGILLTEEKALRKILLAI